MMDTKNQSNKQDKIPKDVGDELDAINAQIRRPGATRLRRRIEATIEARARKRRNREAPASSAWKA